MNTAIARCDTCGPTIIPTVDQTCCCPVVNQETACCTIDWPLAAVQEWIGLEVFTPRVLSRLALGTKVAGQDMLMIPDQMVEEAVRTTTIEMATRLGLLRRIIRIDLQACVPDYYLEVCGEEILLNVTKVHEKQFSQAVNFFGRAYHNCGMLMPSYTVSFLPPQTFAISPAPNQDMPGGLSVEVTTIPSPNACKVDKMFFDRHLEAVIQGAAAKLLESANPVMAKAFEQRYQMKMGAAGNALYNSQQGAGSIINNPTIG